MWDELDQIPWTRLEHNYGPASDVPGLLRLCADDDAERAAEALDDLDVRVFHQGGWICSAAPAILLFLLDLAEGRATHYRAETVELIARFVQEALIVKDRFLDPDWPAAAELAVPRWFRAPRRCCRSSRRGWPAPTTRPWPTRCAGC